MAARIASIRPAALVDGLLRGRCGFRCEDDASVRRHIERNTRVAFPTRPEFLRNIFAPVNAFAVEAGSANTSDIDVPDVSGSWLELLNDSHHSPTAALYCSDHTLLI
jgi:hypothetical protein